jgi:hypothetical protein
VGRPLWEQDACVICHGHSQHYISFIFTILLVGRTPAAILRHEFSIMFVMATILPAEIPLWLLWTCSETKCLHFESELIGLVLVEVASRAAGYCGKGRSVPPGRMKLLRSDAALTSSESQLRFDQRLVGQTVAVSIPICGSRSDSCGFVERTGLSFTTVIVSSTCHQYLQFYMSTFYIALKSPVSCWYYYFIFTSKSSV